MHASLPSSHLPHHPLPPLPRYALFARCQRAIQGSAEEIWPLLLRHLSGDRAELLLIDQQHACLVELDGGEPAVRQRLFGEGRPTQTYIDTPVQRQRGRPRLGVIAREVTLLPEHWAWLGVQPGGASQTLRRLVDEDRAQQRLPGDPRAGMERAYELIGALSRHYPTDPGWARALFTAQANDLRQALSHWPFELREHLLLLAAIG